MVTFMEIMSACIAIVGSIIFIGICCFAADCYIEYSSKNKKQEPTPPPYRIRETGLGTFFVQEYNIERYNRQDDVVYAYSDVGIEHNTYVEALAAIQAAKSREEKHLKRQQTVKIYEQE